jgi:hypothetical protein
MSSLPRWFLPVAAALTLAAPASAQRKPLADEGPAWTIPASLTTSPSAFDSMKRDKEAARDARTFAAPVLPGVTRQSEDVALMIVGGAALIIGSVIDDDAGTLMMVGGGVVGLVGLYRYMT